MPMPVYLDFNPAHLVAGDVVISAVGDPWRNDWPWERIEVVTDRPWGRIITTHDTYFWHGRQLSTWWRFWEYPRRITAHLPREDTP